MFMEAPCPLGDSVLVEFVDHQLTERGQRIGGIEISLTHANFLVNPCGVGGATAADVIAMMTLIQKTVYQRFGVELEAEMQRVGEWG